MLLKTYQKVRYSKADYCTGVLFKSHDCHNRSNSSLSSIISHTVFQIKINNSQLCTEWLQNEFEKCDLLLRCCLIGNTLPKKSCYEEQFIENQEYHNQRNHSQISHCFLLLTSYTWMLGGQFLWFLTPGMSQGENLRSEKLFFCSVHTYLVGRCGENIDSGEKIFEKVWKLGPGGLFLWFL